MYVNKDINLGSTGLVYAPGFIAAMRNDYNVGGEYRERAVKTVADVWLEGDEIAAEYILANPDKCRVIDGDALAITGVPMYVREEVYDENYE